MSGTFPDPIPPTGPPPHWLAWAESWWFLASGTTLLALLVLGLVLYRRSDEDLAELPGRLIAPLGPALNEVGLLNEPHAGRLGPPAPRMATVRSSRALRPPRIWPVLCAHQGGQMLIRMRRLLRAAAGHRDWLVHDVDRGIVRRERTRRAANLWGDRWFAFHNNRELSFMILPVDRCDRWNIDPTEPELYPGDMYANGPVADLTAKRRTRQWESP